MSYLVCNLLENRGKPVSVQLSTPVTDALSLMLENDFSQLPTIDADEKPIGFVTYRGIIRTIWYLDCPIEELHVENVYEKITKTQIYRSDDNLFDMLDRLRDNNAILVVDGNDRLIGIVTSYDATEYYRMRAEDMMQVEDIEATLKDLILSAFTISNSELNTQKLQAAIEKIKSSNQPTKKDYAIALSQYLTLANGQKVDQSFMEQSYEEYLKQPAIIPEFSELTLYDYIEILLSPDQSEFFQGVFPHSQDQIRKLFHGVRETRNALAHFREIKPAQRDQLLYCKNLLEKITISIPVNWLVSSSIENVRVQAVQEARQDYFATASTPILPIDEEVSPTESKYAPLIFELQNVVPDQRLVRFTFDRINEILDGGLPPSARTHRAWWANDSVGHVQSQLWLDAGWRTTYINMTDETVVFSCIEAVEKRYINFFSALQTKLNKANIPVKKNVSIHGKNWMTFYQIPEAGAGIAVFGFSFTRQRNFRVEIYIDSGNKEQNKAIYDLLFAQRSEIERKAGQEISWERIDIKRASRIAVYHFGHIADTEDQLEQLRDWAISTMETFYTSIIAPTLQAIKQVVGS